MDKEFDSVECGLVCCCFEVKRQRWISQGDAVCANSSSIANHEMLQKIQGDF